MRLPVLILLLLPLLQSIPLLAATALPPGTPPVSRSAPLIQTPATNAPVGRIISASGSVLYRDGNGESGELRRGSEIFPDMAVITESGGFTQLRLIDSTTLTLAPDSELIIHTIISDGPGGSPDQAELELLRGGFRKITGSIGQEAQDTYRMLTPYGTVSARRATYGCVIDSVLNCGVWDGGLSFTNQAGSMHLGLGGNSDYLEVTAATAAPSMLLQEPARLGNLGSQGRRSSGSGTALPNQPKSIQQGPAGGNPSFPAPDPLTVTPVRK